MEKKKTLEELALERNRLLIELSLAEERDPRHTVILDPIREKIKAVEEEIKKLKRGTD